MVMMLAPSKVASDAGNHDEPAEKTARRQPRQRPAGSADPAEISPEQI
jgi:hypothetical protein